MQPGNSPRFRVGTCSIAALALASALAPTPVWAIASRSSDGALSPRLAELAKPSVRSAPPAAQARELSLAAEGPGSLLRQGNRILVDVRFDQGAAAAVEDLRAAGAKVLDVSSRYQTVTVAAKPADLWRLAAVPRVAGAREVLRPITAASTCPSGAVVSEGVKQLRAGDGEDGKGQEARKAFGVDGSGVTVGILSDSFNRATEAADGSGPVATQQEKDVENGDLPGLKNECLGQTTPVTVLGGDPETEGQDEGRAMAQIVHDVAPGSKLAFATAFTSDVFGFAENIEKLAEPILSGGADADVIADDVFFFEEPFFQEGPVDNAVRKVTEVDEVTYFSAAGNDNLFDSSGNEIGSWEAQQFRDAGSCPPAVVALSEELEASEGFGLHPTHCLDFNPGAQVDRTFGIKVAPGATLSIDLQWSEPWNGVGTDVDAFLLNSTGGLIAASGEDNVGDSQMPFEFLQWENESSSSRTVQFVANRYAGALPRLKLALLENGSGVAATEYPRSTGTDVVGPTVFGHSGSAKAISVGAVPFDDSSEAEEYSSRGPVRHDFGPVEGTEAAAPLEPSEILSKPDLAATDCGLTTFFAFFAAGGWRFCGTSAAAPHAAAVAALMLDEESSATEDEIRTAMQASAVEVGAYGPCAVGAGLVEAVGAIEDLLLPPTFTAPECSTPEPEGSVEEAQAPGNWGLEAPPSPPSTPTEFSPGPNPTEPRSPPRPRTFFLLHPARVIRTSHLKAKAVFRFGASESGATFVCRVDSEPFRECRRRFVGRFAVGPHAMRVIARDAAGNADRTPAVYRFRVKRIG